MITRAFLIRIWRKMSSKWKESAYLLHTIIARYKAYPLFLSRSSERPDKYKILAYTRAGQILIVRDEVWSIGEPYVIGPIGPATLQVYQAKKHLRIIEFVSVGATSILLSRYVRSPTTFVPSQNVIALLDGFLKFPDNVDGGLKANFFQSGTIGDICTFCNHYAVPADKIPCKHCIHGDFK